MDQLWEAMGTVSVVATLQVTVPVMEVIYRGSLEATMEILQQARISTKGATPMTT